MQEILKRIRIELIVLALLGAAIGLVGSILIEKFGFHDKILGAVVFAVCFVGGILGGRKALFVGGLLCGVITGLAFALIGLPLGHLITEASPQDAIYLNPAVIVVTTLSMAFSGAFFAAIGSWIGMFIRQKQIQSRT